MKCFTVSVTSDFCVYLNLAQVYYIKRIVHYRSESNNSKPVSDKGPLCLSIYIINTKTLIFIKKSS